MKVPEKQNRQRGNKGSQHIPKHVTPGGQYHRPPTPQKGQPCNSYDSKYTRMHTHTYAHGQ